MTTQPSILHRRRASLGALLLAFAMVGVPFSFTATERAEVNGIEIAYETFGSHESESILLIAGLGAQLTMWSEELCERLVKDGYHVIRYDNREAGLSTHLDSLGAPDWAAISEAASSGRPLPLPYSLGDMADDAAALLDALGVEKAHLVGASMGGGIAQLVAIRFPARGRSLTCICADTGNPEMPGPTEEVLAMPPAPPKESPISEIVERELVVQRLIGSPAYRIDDETLRASIRSDVERSYNPAAMERQAAAVMFAGDRRQQLRELELPSVVLHGDADPLVPIENGRDIAQNIPEAELRVVEGMGHDLPPALTEEIAAAILAAASRTTGAGAASATQTDGSDY